MHLRRRSSPTSRLLSFWSLTTDVHYVDEIQCAAARVVAAIREHVRKLHPQKNPTGEFDTFHIRRGDFQVRIS